MIDSKLSNDENNKIFYFNEHMGIPTLFEENKTSNIMKLVYGITVSTEENEVIRLIELILKHGPHKIVVQYDENKSPHHLINKLNDYEIDYYPCKFENDFADFKNKLTERCLKHNADYIFQLDADEIISEFLLENVKSIIEENSQVDLFYIPRINTVEGITMEHINKWKWNLDKQGRINFPDYQGRIFKSKLQWTGKVHERISGAKNYSLFPLEEEYCILHNKTIERQEVQNTFYNSL